MEQTEAILIRKRKWSDTSLITTWFTANHGKVTTVAKAARRAGSPFAGGLDLFHRVEIAYVCSRKSAVHTLREVRLIEPFNSVGTTNLFLCGYFAELVDLVTQPGCPAPEIFDLLNRAYRHLSNNPANTRALEFFENELCRLMGIEDSATCTLVAIETYCGRIPTSRKAAVDLLNPRITP